MLRIISFGVSGLARVSTSWAEADSGDVLPDSLDSGVARAEESASSDSASSGVAMGADLCSRQEAVVSARKAD